MSELLRYGDHPDQIVHLHPPSGEPRGVAILVHGGYWRQAYDYTLMTPLADDLTGRGWAVANVEYRRGAEGLTATLQDARAAVDTGGQAARRRGWGGPLVSIGHSVGGQLALLTADLVQAVVALAPVTDLARTRAERLGDEAVAEFIAQSPQEAPDRYAAGSPIAQLPVGRPTLLVHGDNDTRVPLAHTQDFAARAGRAGDDVQVSVLPGAGHRELIDPQQGWWPGIIEWMGRDRTALR